MRIKIDKMKIKWGFKYTSYLILIPAIFAIGYFKQPYWYNPLSILLVLIVEIVKDQWIGKKEKLINAAKNLKRLSDSFSIFVDRGRNNSIPSIFKALLANDVFTERYGRGIKGWKLYLEEQANNLLNDYNEFKSDLDRYIENPKGKSELSDIIRRFGKLVKSHYKLHLNFLDIIKDMGILPKELGQKYKEFKTEYDDFCSDLKGDTSDFEEVAPSVFIGKSFSGRAQELPEVEFI